MEELANITQDHIARVRATAYRLGYDAGVRATLSKEQDRQLCLCHYSTRRKSLLMMLQDKGGDNTMEELANITQDHITKVRATAYRLGYDAGVRALPCRSHNPRA
jgi:hypothetical protein